MTTPDEPTECPPVELAVGGKEEECRDQEGATTASPVVRVPAGPSQSPTVDEKSAPTTGTPVATILDPVPSDPAPSDPAPSDPAPSDPAPSDPAPSDPAPSDPAPSDPAPSGVVPPSKTGYVPRTVFDFREMEAQWRKGQDIGRVGGTGLASREKKPKGSARAAAAVSSEQDKRREGNSAGAHRATPDHQSPFSQATSMYLRNMFGGPQSKRIEKLLVKYL